MSDESARPYESLHGLIDSYGYWMLRAEVYLIVETLLKRAALVDGLSQSFLWSTIVYTQYRTIE